MGDLMTASLPLFFPAKIHVPADISISQCYWFDHEQRYETDFLIHALIVFVGEWRRLEVICNFKQNYVKYRRADKKRDAKRTP